MIYGYARVSSNDQKLDRQIDALLAFGVPPDNIFSDKLSGKDFERKHYLCLIKKLRPDDLLVILSIDRLGRNYDMILEEWTRITKKIQADILVLDMPLLDTRTREKDLTGRLIADIVLQILCYVAEKERENTKIRQREGIAAAKSRGVKFGRPTVALSDEFYTVAKAYREGTISLNEAVTACGLSKSTFYRYAMKM